MHFSLTIFRLFFILGMTINQANFSLIGPKNVNIGKTSSRKNTVTVIERTSNRRNIITIESNIKNE